MVCTGTRSNPASTGERAQQHQTGGFSPGNSCWTRVPHPNKMLNLSRARGTQQTQLRARKGTSRTEPTGCWGHALSCSSITYARQTARQFALLYGHVPISGLSERTYGLYITCFLEPKTVPWWLFVSSDTEKQGERIMCHCNAGGTDLRRCRGLNCCTEPAAYGESVLWQTINPNSVIPPSSAAVACAAFLLQAPVALCEACQ